MNEQFELKTVPLSSLKPHPKNYREHPEAQLAHICESIKQHGLYRNIVTAKDLTILAGHGVTAACKLLGRTEVPVIQLNIEPDSTEALKVLAGDNEISNLADVNDRMLTEILKDVKSKDALGLLGTGFDDLSLANLLVISRPESEVADLSAAAKEIGMENFEAPEEKIKLIINFQCAETKREALQKLGIEYSDKKVMTVNYAAIK
jgi:ParB-like chromosome segregation protein Spo0J